MSKIPFSAIGSVRLPQSIIDYVEANDLRITIEQTAFDAMNGYAAGVGTKITIQQFCEYCTICGWHSIKNPNQKRLPVEQKHKLTRGYETIFSWDTYGTNNESLAEAFEREVIGESNKRIQLRRRSGRSA